MSYIGRTPVVGNFVKLDAITTSATATYNLLNGGVAYFPQTANNCIVSLNGVIQSPTSAYTISGSTIVFDSALTSADSIDFILVLGDVLSIGTPSDGTITNAKLALTAGSAGTPTISPAADTNTGIFFPAADTIGFAEGGTEAMRMDSSGRLLVGIETSRTQGYGDASSLQIEGTSYPKASIGLVNNSNNGDAPSINFGKSRGTSVGSNTVVQNGDNLGLIFFSGADGTDMSTGGASIIAQVDGTPGSNDMPGRLLFNTTADGASSPTERMRITSTGDLLYSTTSVSPHFNGDGLQITEDGRLLVGQSGQLCAIFGRNTSNGEMIRFDRSGTDVGSIDVTTTATSYNTSSDYRLKENVSYDFDATTRLKQLKPARFNFITEPDNTVDGFIAHEVQSVIPEAITGIKDETETKEKVVINVIGQVIAENIEQSDWEAGKILNEEGKSQYPIDSTWEASKIVPVYQGIDQAKLTPILTKALQEAIAKIESLEARLIVLESKIS
jgi:hypothetical protein